MDKPNPKRSGKIKLSHVKGGCCLPNEVLLPKPKGDSGVNGSMKPE
jgi:hypothetical protein